MTFYGTEAFTGPAETLRERDMGVACPAVGSRAGVPEGPWARAEAPCGGRRGSAEARPPQQVLTVFCLSDTLIWKRVIDSQAEKLKELDKEIRPFRQNWEEADSMKSSVESLQNRVTELESVDKSAGQAARNTGEPA